VKELDVHATAEQVYDHIAQKYPTISKATVYRNLNQMAESGVLINIGNFHGSSRYDYNCCEHSHFICEECGRVYDVDIDFSDIYDKAGTTGEYEISGCSISFSGLCRNCITKKMTESA